MMKVVFEVASCISSLGGRLMRSAAISLYRAALEEEVSDLADVCAAIMT